MNQPQWRRGQQITCGICGQVHLTAEPHVYDYTQEVDEDLLCQICLQPLVAPTDTKCGHTFCQACLLSYLQIQPLCPLDRTTLTPSDCQPASLMVKRLLDKLMVKCPSTSVCDTEIPRSELEDHLKFRCPGIVACRLTASVECGYQGPRKAVHRHQPSCVTLPKPQGAPQTEIIGGELCKIEILRTCPVLGISIVGGHDSPLRCIVIQEVLPDGLVGQDGRLQPGDQLIEVNGDDLTRCTHMQACAALLKSTPSLMLTVYRDRTEPYGTQPIEDALKIILDKQPGKQLGIKLSAKRFEPGIFISELMEGSVAALDGQLQPDDRILEINRQDMRQGRLEEASLLIQTSPRNLELLVARQTSPASSANPKTSLNATNSTSFTSGNTSQDVSLCQRSTRRSPRPPPDRPLQPKYFTITKSANESLGISVAGGMRSQQGDTPIYVTNMQTHGCLGRSKQIKKGDILLSVNGTSLLGISHSEAVAELKVTANQTSVSLGVIEGPETSSAPGNFIPSWMYWQSLPRTLHMPKTVVLHRSCTGSLGFSIVGGRDSIYGNQPIHILLVVQDSPAAQEGKLKCGDQILSVNGHRLDSVRHSTAVAMLKQAKNRVALEVLSWPGTQL